MARHGRAGFWLGALLMGATSMAQAAEVTVAAYQRAAAMLQDRTAPLLDGVVSALCVPWAPH